MTPVAAITGAASGIGHAVAVRYGSAGYRVVIGYHSADSYDPEATVRAVKDAGGQAVTHAVDVRSAEEVESFTQRGLDEWGRLDIAVANAGVLRKVALEDMSDDDFTGLLDINLTGALRVFRSAAQRIEDGGALVAVSSIAGGVYGWSEHAHYATGKAGLIGLVKSAAVELGPRGIRVNAVIPGTIDTPQAQDEVNSLGAEGIIEQGNRLPLRRAGRPADIANAIAFLSSAEASFITGTTLTVDGGMTAMMPG